MIIDGKAIAAEILARTKERVVAHNFAHPPRIVAIVANDTPATRSYLAIKSHRAEDAGCGLSLGTFPTDINQTALIEAISGIVADKVDAIIVQLPLPAGIDTQAVCDSIPLEKDADVLSTAAWGKFEAHELDALVPPVAAAVAEILEKYAIDPKGKRVAIVGNGRLVGQPCVILFRHLGADVAVLNSHSDLNTELKTADIIISGAGSPHLIKPEMIKDGVVLIDAGTSESGGALAGDADPSAASKCALFTPVPGGVGPIAVAKLFENAVILAERARR